ncbi:hypothetical protein A2164_01580 [Candidatus Curtissbacteria bacterium RBG_13_35_7]|uniref:Type II secretion system protein GspG C-terminal domain-containing protein n=1 Tax=Candidatus Curtissbacteria bacterium RBG_13_35_7 TaxID=1797705 RepID=A0A1F5G4K5_9BACT|nr:MAG: hypothetical protein A2164_01580 [Candidatus Curtissbacteria bacterium RBG_13_35_7]
MHFLPKTKKLKAFTLIELLVVIGVLTILFAIVLIAVNPGRQFAQANDTQRRSDINAILNAVHQYAAENKGALPTDITTTPGIISSTAIDICADIVPTYIAAMPVDPVDGSWNATDGCTTYDTDDYSISKSATGNRVTVSTPAEVGGSTLSVTR